MLISLVLLPSTLVAQTKLSGTIINSKNESVPYVNLLVLEPSDSSFIKGELISDGAFNVSLSDRSYLLKFQATGFDSYFQLIDHSSHLGDIVLKEKTLDEVVISAQQLPFENNQGNVKINVENSLFSSSSSITEVLTKSPGVSVNNNGITVVGRGDALVYIDGKLSTVDAMKAIPVSLIKSVEIVKNPDASYDAVGKAVILVTLKDLGLEGIQSSISANFTKAFYQLGYVDASLNWRSGKWSLTSSGNINLGATGTRRYDQFNIPNNPIPYTAHSDYFEKVKLSNVSNYLLGVKHQFNSKHSASVQFNGNYSDYLLDVRTNIYQQLEDSIHAINAIDKGISVWKTNTISGNYSFAVDSLGSQLFVGVNYSLVSSDYHDSIIELHSGNDQLMELNSISMGLNQNNLFVAQVDFNKNFAKGGQLKTGAKMTNTGTSSDIDLETISEAEQINDLHRNISYDEQLIAGYVNWNGQLKQANYQLGIRLEHTTSKAHEQSIGTYIDTNYLSLFPNASITLDLKKWKMTDQFNSKITRPSYTDVTPYIFYLNTFASVQGNPELLPSYNYNLEHKFTHKELGTNISIGLNHVKNARSFVPSQNQNSETIITYSAVNLQQQNEAYFEIAQGIDKKFWRGYTMVNISVNTTNDDRFDFDSDKIIPKVYLYSYNRFPVKEWFNFELIGAYTSSFSDGTQTFQPQGELGLGISKSFSENKWFVQISGNDIFQTAKKISSSNLFGNQYDFNTTMDTRFIRFSVSYQFGKLKESNFNHQNINENELQRAQ